MGISWQAQASPAFTRQPLSRAGRSKLIRHTRVSAQICDDYSAANDASERMTARHPLLPIPAR